MSAGITAGFDQHRAATREVEHRFSTCRCVAGGWCGAHNWAAQDDTVIGPAVLDALAGAAEGWTTLGWDDLGNKLALLYPANGTATGVAPDADLAALVRATAPRVALCDRCRGEETPSGWLLIAAPPRLVALALCPSCDAHLSVEYGAQLIQPRVKES